MSHSAHWFAGRTHLPTSQVRILGFTFELPQPYSVGHVCSTAEAAALNKVLVKGISKGLYKVLAAALRPTGYTSAAGVAVEAAAKIWAAGNEYISDYSLGFSEGHEIQRAIRIEAERIGRQMLETQLYKQGKSLKDLSEADKTDQIAQYASSDKVRTEAERRVKVTQEIAEKAHGELLESLGENGSA